MAGAGPPSQSPNTTMRLPRCAGCRSSSYLNPYGKPRIWALKMQLLVRCWVTVKEHAGLEGNRGT